jgi:WD40 repeat protein
VLDGKATLVSKGVELRVWEVQTGKVKWMAPQVNAPSLLFTADGKTLVGGAGPEIRLWDADTGEVKGKLKNPEGAAFHLALSRDGKVLAGSGNGFQKSTLNIWNVKEETRLHSLTLDKITLDGMGLSADGKTLVTISRDENDFARLSVLDVGTGKVRRTIPVITNGFAGTVALAPDGRTVAAINDHMVRTWDVRTGAVKKTLKTELYRFAFTASGTALVGNIKQDVQLLDLRTGRLRRLAAPKLAAVTAFALSRDGKVLVVAGGEPNNGRVIQVWKLTSLK